MSQGLEYSGGSEPIHRSGLPKHVDARHLRAQGRAEFGRVPSMPIPGSWTSVACQCMQGDVLRESSGIGFIRERKLHAVCG